MNRRGFIGRLAALGAGAVATQDAPESELTLVPADRDSAHLLTGNDYVVVLCRDEHGRLYNKRVYEKLNS